VIWLRSVLFAALALAWSAILGLLYLPLLALPRRHMQAAARFWIRGILLLLAVVCRLRHRVLGAENLPAGPSLVAAKHQSAWDTLIFHLLCRDPVYVMKKELLAVPVFGWYLAAAGNIPVDRRGGFRAIKALTPAVERRLAEGAQIIIFPEGTRTSPGERRPYHPGIAALASHAAAPVVPVALNSGLFWGRKHLRKLPGTITVQILPPLKAGLDRRVLMAELTAHIDTASAELCAAAGGGHDGSEMAATRLRRDAPLC
jgi:1-acyl-sn-glycerol-3-phosphate acyltransferase